jgi:DNA-binding HxlR family transcriptional regulator
MKRSYAQFCGVARALDVVGERWTLLIIRNLLLGPRRYGTLLAELPGITTNLLAKRLHELQAAGIVEQRQTQDAALWSLSDRGRALEPVVIELGRFGAAYLDKPRRGDRIDLGWALISLKRRYVPGALEGTLASVETTDAVPRRFELSGRGAYLSVLERASPHATVSVRGPEEAIRAWLFGRPHKGLTFVERGTFARAFGLR